MKAYCIGPSHLPQGRPPPVYYIISSSKILITTNEGLLYRALPPPPTGQPTSIESPNWMGHYTDNAMHYIVLHLHYTNTTLHYVHCVKLALHYTDICTAYYITRTLYYTDAAHAELYRLEYCRRGWSNIILQKCYAPGQYYANQGKGNN